MDNELKAALNSIHVASLARQEWIQVGMALKAGGEPCSVWDEWSKEDKRYHAGECERLWAGFNGSGINTGTIIALAKEKGWQRFDGDGCLEWDDVIEYDGIEPVGNSDQFNPVDELRRYITKLFDPDDHVSYVVEARQDEDGKWKPFQRGTYHQTAADILRSLDKYPDDIGATIGDYHKEAGAWIRFNPVDGEGVGNKNVTRFRYALVESDDMPIAEQNNRFREWQLPIAMLVNSGGKSLHAIVKVDAANAEEYRQRVNMLYNFLEEHGCSIDHQNSNPSRLSRMPGVTRGENKQYIVAEDIGRNSWADWLDYVEGADDELPPIISLDDYGGVAPEPPPPIIDGVLRRGHKMLISGQSKSGKSFLLMELAVAIAKGAKWLGMQCKKGRVLYVNLEIDDASFGKRFFDISTAQGDKTPPRVDIWNLRGKTLSMNELAPKLIRRAKGYDAIILDPIYKVITGDENNASEMGKFCNLFDKVCNETGCTLIYCHHFSKGAQGAKKAMDRSSGSGVFARDPDAVLTMTELVLTDEVKNKWRDNGATAWRVEFVLREFKSPAPVDVWFDAPVHRLDEVGCLAKLGLEGSPTGNLSKSSKRMADDDRLDEMWDAYDALGDAAKLSEYCHYLDRSERTIRNWFTLESSDVGKTFTLKNGLILLAERGRQ